MKKEPYLITTRVVVDRHYNPDYGDERMCECGHPYYRHFDTYEEMAVSGCKYCGCWDFVEGVDQTGTSCTIEGCEGELQPEYEDRPACDLVCTQCGKHHFHYKRGLDHPDWLDRPKS